MNTYALFMWIIMSSTAGAPNYGWVYQTDFSSKERCVSAARDLISSAPARAGEGMLYRCLAK